MLAQQNKGLRVFHEANRNHWQEQWQALGENRDIFSSLPFFRFFIARFSSFNCQLLLAKDNVRNDSLRLWPLRTSAVSLAREWIQG
ncbi:hypothetical protein ALQ94_102076 [Pseudomonas amygdali pv. morsprunorum]|uniref:Uncharacterized protein n=1 Tax=Pseudomonas amygdali pv. morsprunorum TaxID=129138 RepID=A0A3M2WRD9_PSEA0|nr:hypothetical protein ALQ94_102076 [Pseudomonas amygdali pv. morsprunorum]